MGEIRSKVKEWNDGGWVSAFEPGDPVSFEHGPLRTLRGIFQRYTPGNRRCQVLVSLMERQQQVQVDIADLTGFATGRRFGGVSA